MSPPLRPKETQDRLWRGLAYNDLQAISTDHCPFCMKEQKTMGEGDFSKIPNGAPGIETRMSLVYDGGVRTGRISLNRFVELTSTSPAKIFGLFPRKGTIAPGSDADIVIFDPEKKLLLSATTLHMKVDYNPYEGREVTGVTDTVISRGRVIIDGGAVHRQRRCRELSATQHEDMNASARNDRVSRSFSPRTTARTSCRSQFEARSGRRCRTSSCSSPATAAPTARGTSSDPFDDPRIRWFDLPKAPGIGYANRNAVLREARGSNIAYLAHDDIWFPDHLERLGWLLDRPHTEFAYTRGIGVDIHGRMLPYWYNLGVPRHQDGLWRGDSAITMTTVGHSRECLDKYGYWDETMRFSADLVMWHRIVMGGRFKNLAFDSNPTSLHFVARWRNTTAHRVKSWVDGWLLDGFIDENLPGVLRLRAHPDRTQQEAAWLRLARDPAEDVRAIREGVVQLSDTMLWRSRTLPQLAGLRFGLLLGSLFDRCVGAAMWVASPRRRRLLRKPAGQNAGAPARRSSRHGSRSDSLRMAGLEHERDIFDGSSGPNHRGLVTGQDAGRSAPRPTDGHA